jgi:hypothetical protein
MRREFLLSPSGCDRVTHAMHIELDDLSRPAVHALLVHILAVARERDYARLSLETGSMDAFRAAGTLYACRCGDRAAGAREAEDHRQYCGAGGHRGNSGAPGKPGAGVLGAE